MPNFLYKNLTDIFSTNQPIRGERFNFSLSGTVIQNRNNTNLAQDFRAEAKLGFKF